MTNATKAGIMALINAVLGLAVAFNVVLTTGQQGAVITAANAVLSLWIVLTYKQSPKRVPDKP